MNKTLCILTNKAYITTDFLNYVDFFNKIIVITNSIEIEDRLQKYVSHTITYNEDITNFALVRNLVLPYLNYHDLIFWIDSDEVLLLNNDTIDEINHFEQSQYTYVLPKYSSAPAYRSIKIYKFNNNKFLGEVHEEVIVNDFKEVYRSDIIFYSHPIILNTSTKIKSDNYLKILMNLPFNDRNNLLIQRELMFQRTFNSKQYLETLNKCDISNIYTKILILEVTEYCEENNIFL